MENDHLNKQKTRVINHAFIIRIWHEIVDIPDRKNVWRGLIIHVGDEKQLNFNNFEAISRFIQEQTGIKSIHPLSWWRFFLTWLRRDQS